MIVKKLEQEERRSMPLRRTCLSKDVDTDPSRNPVMTFRLSSLEDISQGGNPYLINQPAIQDVD